MRITHVAGSAVVVVALAAGAQAAPVSLHYSDVNQGTRSGFGFSVVHHPTNDAGAGDIMFRLSVASLDAQWDDTAGTLTFTGMQGQLFEENNLDPNTFGPQAGTIELASVAALSLSNAPAIGSDPLSGSGGDFLSGDIDFTMTLFGGDGALGGGDDVVSSFTIRFLAQHYNPLANRFDPGNEFNLGLWGATPEVFSTGPTADSLAVDIFASNPVIPLPTPAGLAAIGLCCLSLRRRRS